MSVDIIYCIPQGHKCLNTNCKKHSVKAPEGVVIYWNDFWHACPVKMEKELPFKDYRYANKIKAK